MRIVRPLLALVLLALAAPTLGAERADAISRLEQARTRNPQSVAALRALGVAYFKANRFAEARTVLDQARQLDPRDGVSALYAGLSSEKLRDFTGAKNAYNAYLVNGRSRRARTEVQQRLVALAREESIALAKAAVANEARLSQTPGDRRTIAVPPLKFSGPDREQLAPLERGLAELIITDLARSSQLTIVERDRMQAIADEIALGESGRVDAGSAVRAGKLIQAGRLVNGTIVQGGNQLTLSSSIVEVSTAQLSEPASVTNNVDAIFALQKLFVFRIFDQLGIVLTPAERQLVDRQATTNLNAFLAYSRGLSAADDGRFEDAARFFDNARTLDPNFSAAGARFAAAQAAAAGAQVTAATLQSGLTGNEAEAVTGAENGVIPTNRGLTNTLTNVAQTVNPPAVAPISNTTITTQVQIEPAPNRDAPSNTGGTDTPVARTGTVTIVIRRP
jgi:TolB-like protein/thioredoxin-like negative regulator of GroEL